MSFVIRPARAEDVSLIESWTRDTFTWGDYVAEGMPAWLEDPESLVVVCVFEDDVPVALSRAQMLSPTEAWLSAARVHPDHRRSGMGMAMNDYGVDWARERGALVARLATEVENEAARAQVAKLGYRLTGHWAYAAAPPPPVGGWARASGFDRVGRWTPTRPGRSGRRAIWPTPPAT